MECELYPGMYMCIHTHTLTHTHTHTHTHTYTYSLHQLLDSSDSAVAYDLIQQLATESSRYTARKDRNQQRACFRDFLQTLQVSVARSHHGWGR